MHRLRELDRRGRVIALVVALALAAPFAASVGKAIEQRYTPTNDEALITLRAYDVLDGHFPLVGQPSTAAAYADSKPPHHPGPIEFYLLAPFVALLGPDLGMLVGAGAFNLSAVLISVWVVFRRVGPAVALGAAVVCSAVAWSEGLAVLTDPISSNMGGIPLLALAVLVWALLDGDLRLVPLAAFVFAFVCQQHLAIVGVSLGTALLGVVGVVAATVAAVRSRKADTADTADIPASDGVPSPWPWLFGGLAVTAVAWLPVAVDEAFGRHNLRAMSTFAGSSQRPTLGIGSGFIQAGHALALPPLLVRTDLVGGSVRTPLSALAWIGVAAAVGALVAIVVLRWRTCRAHALLALTTLVLALVGAWNGGNVPDSLEADRLNFFRWTFVVSAAMCLSLGWAAASLVAARWPDRSRRSSPAFAAIAVVVVVAVGAAAIAAGRPQARRDDEIFVTSAQLGAASNRATAGHHKVLLLLLGGSAHFSTGPAVAVDLVDGGHEIRVPRANKAGWGSSLILDRDGEHVDDVLAVVTANGKFPADLPGRLVRRVDLKADIRSTIAALVDQARGHRVVLAPDADAALDKVLPGADPRRIKVLKVAMGFLADDPETVLANQDLVRLLLAGYLSSPHLDPARLRRLDESGNTLNWGDDLMEVRQLTPAEAETYYGVDLTPG